MTHDPATPRARGTVFLVGAGPGDAGLITVRGRDLLEQCDAVVYDALANPILLDIARFSGRPVELHDVGKRGGGAIESARQDEITALLVRLGRDGKRVVRLKGGDPLVFGRGSEEAQALADARIPFEVVPGVTAGIAAPAYAGIPVTHRGLATSVTFVTGHEDPAKDSSAAAVDWSALAHSGGTLVLYMGMTTLPEITRALVGAGMAADTPAAAIQWGTLSRQRTVVATVSTLVDRAAAEGIGAPAITVIGPVVALREQITWFDTRPLFGRRIVVTRARSQAASLASLLREAGAEAVEMPATRVEPLDPTPLNKRLASLTTYAWAIFTSQNAVELFWNALRANALDARALAHTRLAVVGPATGNALLAHGLAVDVAPDRFVSEGVLEALANRQDVVGARVLYACAEGARDVLPEGLRTLGATVDVVPIYRSVPDGQGAADLRAQIDRGEIDMVTFTSASAVDAFVATVGRDVATCVAAASIGPITTTAARNVGFRVEVEAAQSTIPGLVAAIIAGGH